MRKFMRSMVVAAVIGLSLLPASAQAQGVYLNGRVGGVQFGVGPAYAPPVYAPPVYAAPGYVASGYAPPVAYAPAPAYYGAPAYLSFGVRPAYYPRYGYRHGYGYGYGHHHR